MAEPLSSGVSFHSSDSRRPPTLLSALTLGHLTIDKAAGRASSSLVKPVNSSLFLEALQTCLQFSSPVRSPIPAGVPTIPVRPAFLVARPSAPCPLSVSSYSPCLVSFRRMPVYVPERSHFAYPECIGARI